MLSAALSYAKLGWPVFPCHSVNGAGRCTCGKECDSPGKHPLSRNGFKDGTTDVKTISRWDEIYGPERWNLALVTGATSGLVVLDIDGQLGMATYRHLVGNSTLPRTPLVVTGGNGWHVYFAHPGRPVRNSAGKLGPGLDLRGDGGYVVAPPSKHVRGRPYRWAKGRAPGQVELAPMPEWLLARLELPGASESPTEALEDVIPEGMRNSHLTSLAGSMRRRGMTTAAIRAALVQENRSRCQPPLSEAEVGRIATSVGRYVAEVQSLEFSSLPAREEKEEPATLPSVPHYPVRALPPVARELVEAGARAGLPVALTAGACLAAAAAAIGPQSELVLSSNWAERGIVWVPLIAQRGAGKSPAQSLAYGPLRLHDQQAIACFRNEVALFREMGGKEQGRPQDRSVLTDDLTMEALVRRLDTTSGALGIDADELSALLRGVGEYKRGPSGDRGRFLKLWTGTPWRYERATGDIKLLVTRPTVSICGGLQPGLHQLLGGDDDGMRPRWLPHLAEMPMSNFRDLEDIDVGLWTDLLRNLLEQRSITRRWVPSAESLALFTHWRETWKEQARGEETASTSAALVKADVQLGRVALVLAEMSAPGRGGILEAEVMDAASDIMEFTLDCWRALGETELGGLTPREEKLTARAERLRTWLEEHGGKAPKRSAQMAHAGGARTKREFAEVVNHYLELYPGCQREEEIVTQGGSQVTVVLYAPRRV